MPGSTVLDVFSSTRNTQATITYQESGLSLDSGIPEAHELLWISCCNRETRFAADGTAFTGELSERNTKFILCNPFFFAFLVDSFP